MAAAHFADATAARHILDTLITAPPATPPHVADVLPAGPGGHLAEVAGHYTATSAAAAVSDLGVSGEVAAPRTGGQGQLLDKEGKGHLPAGPRSGGQATRDGNGRTIATSAATRHSATSAVTLRTATAATSPRTGGHLVQPADDWRDLVHADLAAAATSFVALREASGAGPRGAGMEFARLAQRAGSRLSERQLRDYVTQALRSTH